MVTANANGTNFFLSSNEQGFAVVTDTQGLEINREVKLTIKNSVTYKDQEMVFKVTDTAQTVNFTVEYKEHAKISLLVRITDEVFGAPVKGATVEIKTPWGETLRDTAGSTGQCMFFMSKEF